MQFVRGQTQDFDCWANAEFCGDRWTFELCLSYFKRLENYTPGFSNDNAIELEAEESCNKELHSFRRFDGPFNIISGREINWK